MTFTGTAVALGVAFVAAGALAATGLPAGALLGATAAVAAMALAGRGPVVPDPLRDLAFVIIGVSLGAGITDKILDDLARWPVSLAGLAVTMLATMAITGRLVARRFGIPPATATLSVSPGALSYAVALAAQGNGDLRVVVVLQSVRLLLVTLCLPPAIVALAGMPPPMAGAAGAADLLNMPQTVALALLGLALGWGLDRIGSPAAYLVGGLAVSGVAHALGWVEGFLPGPVLFFGFVVTGAVIGSRFTRIARSDLLRLGVAGVVATVVSVAVSIVGALCVAWLTGLSFPVVWVAFAPGGVEGMAVIGLALGYDPAFVATHHMFRILLVIAVLPLAVRIATR